MSTPNKLPNLEQSLTEISDLITKMEHHELTLEQSLGHFERGITLVKHCQHILEQAEQKVQILIQKNSEEELSTYNKGDSDESSEASKHDEK